MREIKFRRYKIRLNKMSYQDELKQELGVSYLDEAIAYSEPMQFTGLLDKQGKEIYEGDVVKVLDEWIDHYELYSNYQIEFGSGVFRLENGIPLYDTLDEDCNFEKCNFEVIGNIYEHKHLKEL